MSGREQNAEPREAALSRVEHDTAGQRERVHRQAVREDEQVGKPGAGKPTPDEPCRFADAARDAGASEDEAGSAAAVKRVATPG